MTRSIDAAWGEDDTIFLSPASDNYIEIIHNGMKKKVYYEDRINTLFNVLDSIRSVLLEGKVVFEIAEDNVIVFTISQGKYHSIDDNPSFLWIKTGAKTIKKWHKYDTIIKLDVL